jgi:hypothetical protein
VGLKHSVGATLNKSPDEKLNFWHSKIEIFVDKLEMFSKFFERDDFDGRNKTR